MKRILLAAAVLLMLATTASAQRVAVRINRFTPFGLRPDVRVNGGVNVAVNGFGFRPFRVNNFDVNVVGAPFANGFALRQQAFVPFYMQPFGCGQQFVTPNAIYGQSFYGFSTGCGW